MLNNIKTINETRYFWMLKPEHLKKVKMPNIKVNQHHKQMHAAKMRKEAAKYVDGKGKHRVAISQAKAKMKG